MKTIKVKRVLGAVVWALASGMALAQNGMTEGEVRKVDKDNKKIILKHGEIRNLDMPPMTMVFNVSNPELLDKVQAGDKVQFRAVNEGGKFMVTEIRSAK